MTPDYLFPHHILLGYIALWTAAELIAARLWPLRASCKKISLLHCLAAFVLSSFWLARRFWSADAALNAAGLCNVELPGTFEHHILSLSMAYFIVDTPFAVAFHRAFIVHHALCIVAFAAIMGYWKYLPESTPFFMDFMAWDTTPAPPKLHTVRRFSWFRQQPVPDEDDGDVALQLIMGGLNGIFNLWMAELGGVFFHINRALKDTDLELPSRGLFLLMFTLTRCFLWPKYLWHLYRSAAANHTPFHTVSVVLETGLFATNLHFLYKNVAPIWRAGRLLPHQPKGFHRRWLERHPGWKRALGVFLPADKICMSPSILDFAASCAVPAEADAGAGRAGAVDAAVQKKHN